MMLAGMSKQDLIAAVVAAALIGVFIFLTLIWRNKMDFLSALPSWKALLILLGSTGVGWLALDDEYGQSRPTCSRRARFARPSEPSHADGFRFFSIGP